MTKRFTANTDNIQNSCTQWSVPNPTTDEINNIKSAITSVSASTNVDPRFILAIMIQGSNGCVRAPTTNYGVRNPGLMQSHDGTGSCHDPSVQTPCPSPEINQMIQDGTGGTPEGPGLQQCITSSGASDDSKYYKAARIYNSGSIAAGGNLGAGIATHCYASDLANRLTGWTGTSSGCSEGTIGTLTGTTGGSTGGGSGASSSAGAPTYSFAAPSSTKSQVVTPTPTPTTNPGGVYQQKPTSTSSAASSSTATTTATTTVATTSATSTVTSTTPAKANPTSGNPVSTTDEKYPYAVSSCKSYYTIASGDYCMLVEQKFGITQAQLQQWNAQLKDDCSNLWLGYQYCVSA
jgi:LysM repeat protein